MKSFRALAVLVALGLSLAAAAEQTPFPGLSRFTLDNGLELFVLENHAAPLVYEQISFRAGAYAQDPDTAGLFHLYEHMMFKGNSKFRSAAEVQKAYLDLGVSQWNGSTGAEEVEYHFTVPSDKARQGLEFWSYAVREPLLDSKELASEIDVVSNEILGDFADPSYIAQAAADRALFPSFPWRRDPAGDPAVVKACTVERLRAIKDRFYVPNNAALFVGGDITPDQALAMARAVYGPWKRAADPWASPRPRQDFPAVKAPRYLVYADPNISPAYGVVSLSQRGPDVDVQPVPTYAADVFGYLIQNPAGPFKQALSGNPEFSIPDPDYVGGGYYTQRDGGQIEFQALMLGKSIYNFAQRGQDFAKAVLSDLIPTISTQPDYFAAADYDQVKTILADKQVEDMETVDGFLTQLSFWWSSASTDYYFGYVPAMRKVGPAEISAYLRAFVLGNPPIVMVRVNPAVWAKQKDAFAKLGYETVDASNAYWWKK